MEQIIRVNLRERKITRHEVSADYKDYGGRALISKVLSTEVNPSCHPLGKRNKCVIATGLFAGTPFPCSGRLSIGAKSPLTNGIKESNVGGTAAWKLSRLGIRAIIIEGLPEGEDDLFLILLSKDKSKLIPATEFKGIGTYQLAKLLRDRFGKNASLIMIGPTGEMMLSAAGVAVTDLKGNPCDYAGRGGMGAVLGSKKIKAIVIDDSGSMASTDFYNRHKFNQLSKIFAKKLSETKKELRKYGTPIEISISNELGYLPTKNYQTGRFEGAVKISGETLHDLIRNRGGRGGEPCMPGCPIRCKQTYLDHEGAYLTSGLEYETIVMLGSNCGIDDLDVIAKMDRICDDLGLDTMEMGATIGVAMEAGILSFGDAKGALLLLEQIPKGSPLSRIIANGAEITGKIFAVRRTPTVKGQSLGGYDPRANKGIGVTYASSPMGADHTAGCVIPGRKGFDPKVEYDLLKPDGQERLSLDLQTMVAIIDGFGLCFFIGLDIQTLQILVNLHRAKFGSDITFDDLVKYGKKTLYREHIFNRAAGIQPVQHLPEFFETEQLPLHGTVFDVKSERISKMLNKEIFNIIGKMQNDRSKNCYPTY